MYKFYIIQSLKTTDPSLGEEIFDNIKDRTTSHFFPVGTEKELIDVFEFILMDLSSDKETKGIIHFHCHGNNLGIGLYDKDGKGQLIKWEDLRKHLREFYIRTVEKPIFSFCSCEGFNVARLVPHSEPCPFDYITGSFKKLKFRDSVEGYSFFYDSLIEGKSLSDSIISVREKYSEMDFTCLNGEQLFELAVAAYLENEMIPEKLNIRRKAIEAIIIKEFGFINADQKAYLDHIFTTEGTSELINKMRGIFFS